MTLNHWQCRSRLIGHGVHREVESRSVRNEMPHFERSIPFQRLGTNPAFAAREKRRRRYTFELLVMFFDDSRTGRMSCGNGQVAVCRNVRKVARCERSTVDLKFTLDYVKEALVGGGRHQASFLEFGSELSEPGSNGRCNVNDRVRLSHAGKRRPDEGVGCEQQMIVAINATRVAKIEHTLFPLVKRNHKDAGY